MNLKKSRVLALFITFLISFICHFVYQLFPNFFTSIFFPVNESIWEHMKILYTSIVLYGFIDYFILKKFSIKHNNFFFNLFLISFVSIIIYLILFLPIYYRIGENMFIAIGLMFIVYGIVYIISFYILRFNDIGFKFVWIFLIVFGYFVFLYFTYNPIKINLFYDPLKEIYGIEKENK